MTDSTIGDTTSVVSVQSSVSTRSSRSGLTRQGNPPVKGDTGGRVKKKKKIGDRLIGHLTLFSATAESTFRPLNSGKKSEKGKMRKRHRKTVGGIPQHVQRELGV